MNELKFPDATAASSAITSQLDAWHLTKESFSNLLKRWEEVSKHLGLKSFSIVEEQEKFGTGVAYGKPYKVCLRSTVLNDKIFGKVSVVITSPLVGDPFIATEFIVDRRDNFLALDGSPLFRQHDDTASYRIVCEAIFRVIES
ncbi:hypothetical protein ACIGFL_09265 [Pseudomonas sp. NPDC077649]|uniref:hypothetical protein n=1 Tax=Pseudomonas sp. NPDC077649 TaxID=3364423 RepID=UPI0037C57F4D